MHEGAVVDPVHAQRADKVAFHHPKCFCQQQCVWSIDGDAIDDHAPEFIGHGGIELFARHRMFGACGDGTAASRFREPQAFDLLFCQGHGGIKTDDRELACHFQNSLVDCFLNFPVQIIELRRVIPGHRGAIVSMIDVLGFPAGSIVTFENHSGVRARIIVIFDLYADI